MTTKIDLALLRRRVERIGEQALAAHRQCPCEATYHRAFGKLDGLLQGAVEILRAVGLQELEAEVVATVREAVGAAQAELRRSHELEEGADAGL